MEVVSAPLRVEGELWGGVIKRTARGRSPRAVSFGILVGKGCGHDDVNPVKTAEMKLFNKTFYRFVFGFIAVIAATLALVLVVGAAGK